MPVTVKKSSKTPVTVEKDGSRFFFRLGYRDVLKVQDEYTKRGELQINSYYHSLFERSMYTWENVVDDKGKPVKFDEKTRDAIVFGNERIFSDQEVLDTVLKIVGRAKNGNGANPLKK